MKAVATYIKSIKTLEKISNRPKVFTSLSSRQSFLEIKQNKNPKRAHIIVTVITTLTTAVSGGVKSKTIAITSDVGGINLIAIASFLLFILLSCFH